MKSTRKSPSSTSSRLFLGLCHVDSVIWIHVANFICKFHFYITQTHNVYSLFYMSRPQLVVVRAPGPYIFYLFLVDSHSQYAYVCNKMRHSFPEDPQSHDVCVCMLMKESVIDFEFTLGEGECVCVGWGWGGHCSFCWGNFLVGWFC